MRVEKHMTPAPADIKLSRKRAGLTQNQAAQKVNAGGYRTWQDWETGRRKMPIGVWQLWVRVLADDAALIGDLVYVYCLVDPRTQQPRYVGQTTNPKARLAAHVSTPQPCVCEWMSELLAVGLRPEFRVLDFMVGVTPPPGRQSALLLCALALEHYWLTRLTTEGCSLLNVDTEDRSLRHETHGIGAPLMDTLPNLGASIAACVRV